MRCSKCKAQLHPMIWWMAVQQLASASAPPLQTCDHSPEYWPDELNQLAERLAMTFYEAYRPHAATLDVLPYWGELSDDHKRAYIYTFIELLVEEKVHP